MIDPPNVGDVYDDFGQNLGKIKRVSNTPNFLKSLVSSMKKTSGSRSSDRVTFCEEFSKEDDLHKDPKSSKEQAVLKKRRSKDFDGASDEDDLEKDPTFGLQGFQKVLKKKKTKSKDYKYSDEHFCSKLTMRRKPSGQW